jgi:PAS domain S-box-containing protein
LEHVPANPHRSNGAGPPFTHAIAVGTGWAACGLGLVVLVGWIFGLTALTRIAPGFATMKANTAICFLLGGLSLLLFGQELPRSRGFFGQGAAVIAAGLGFVTIIEYVAGVGRGIDQLAFLDPLTSAANYPGRMSIVTAFCFLLFGVGRIAAGRSGRFANALCLGTATSGSLVSFLAILGYIYSVPQLYRPFAAVAIAPNTAIGLVVLFAGLMATRPDLGWVARMRSQRPGGALFRWLVPAVLILLPTVGWLRLQGELAGFYETRVGLALFTSVNVIALIVIIWRASVQADRLDMDRERVGQALSKSEEDQRHFFELSPQWPWSAGPDGIVSAIPQSFAEMLGQSVAGAVDGGWRALQHPDERARVNAAWARSLQTAEPYDQEMRTRLPDGVYHWFRVRAFPRLDEAGNVIRWYGAIENIHARKLTELALQASEERFRRIYDESPLGIILTQAGDGRILEINSAGARLLEYAPPELIGRTLEGIVQRDEPDTPTGRRLTGRDRWQPLERRFNTKSGKIVTVRIRACRLTQADGRPDQILGLWEDITGQRQSELALVQSQKMEAIGTLTGGMAHDFNNLLGIIIGNLDMLREARPEDAELTELGGEALDAAMRGAELTRSLLAFARRQPLQPRRLELDIVIGGQMRLLSRLLGEDIEIKLNFAEDACGIVADPAQLEAALTNLATNARAAMPHGGKLTIAVSHRKLDAEYADANPDVPAGDYAVIEFTDTGAGMSPEVRERVFEPFFTTKNERGTGLGLSMVFGFIKQSGGHISVYSEIGVGTTFRLYFPCSHVSEEKEIDLRPDGPLSGNGETVLAVEDNLPLRRIVVRQLRGLGYRVEALAVLEAENVDLLFTDVVMPGGMDGFALAEAAVIRQPDIKVVITSGFPQTRYADEMQQREFPLLSKPYRKGNLAQLIRAVLDGRDGKPTA